MAGKIPFGKQESTISQRNSKQRASYSNLVQTNSHSNQLVDSNDILKTNQYLFNFLKLIILSFCFSEVQNPDSNKIVE